MDRTAQAIALALTAAKARENAGKVPPGPQRDAFLACADTARFQSQKLTDEIATRRARLQKLFGWVPGVRH